MIFSGKHFFQATMGALVLSSAFLAGFNAAAASPMKARAKNPWSQEAYVWQRASGAEVLVAMQSAPESVDGFCMLAAEVVWKKTPSRTTPATPVREAHITRMSLDFAKLAALGKPVGLALRVGAFDGESYDYSRDSVAAKTLVALAAELLAAARAGGLEPAELQVDFDCAESKLGAFREWLAALKIAAENTPLVFTALPTWMRHEAEFVALARETDGFVMQVHSLEKPANIDAPFVLCDPEKTLAWARQAETLSARASTHEKGGPRFRIALPTYGYVLGFNPAGKFIGLAAEGPRDWPANTQLRTVRADALAMADLSRRLAAEKNANNFAHADGIIWFRLPVAGDRLAWDATTFNAILGGKPLESRLDAFARWSDETGIAEIVVTNTGQITLPLPREIQLAWTPTARVTAADGLRGFVFERANTRVAGSATTQTTNAGVLRTATNSASAELAPGRSRVLGWLRFDFSDDHIAEQTNSDLKNFIHVTIP